VLCIGAFAHEETENIYPEAPTYETYIESQELFIVVSELYQYYANSEEDVYYNFSHGARGDTLFVDLQTNDCVPDGITALEEQKVKDIFVLNFLSEGNEENAKYYNMTYDTFEVVEVNGVKMYKLQGTYLWDNGELTDEDLHTYGFYGYITATKENLYFITVLYEVENTELVVDELEETFASIYVNGTLFEGDKVSKDVDFASALTFKECVKRDAENYLSDLYGDEYFEDVPLNEEELAEYNKNVRMVCIILIVVFTLPTLIVIIVAIVLIAKHSKNKKKLKELENKLGAPQAPVYTPYTGAYNAPTEENSDK
jgi:hypothetical protein